MKITKILPSVVAVGFIGLAGCSVPSPFISDFNGDSVVVTVPLGSPQSSAYEMARKTCQRAGKNTAELASSQSVGSLGDTEFLFLCLD